MRLLYVNPGMWSGGGARDAMQPLAFAALAAHTPSHHRIRFVDERIETADYAAFGPSDTDAAAISVQTFTARRAYRIADTLRAAGIPVILGGIHVSLMPEEAGEHADILVKGDAEPVWNAVLRDMERGSSRRQYHDIQGASPGSIVFDRRIFRGKRYSPMLPVQIHRGCRYRCSFCSVHAIYGPRVTARPTAAVARELTDLPSRLVLFVDDNLFLHHGLDDLLEALIPLKKLFACQVSIDAAWEPDLPARLAAAGCIAVFVGFESMDPRNLAQVGKDANLRYGEYGEAVRRFRRAGIMVCGSFVFGGDGDTAASIQAAYDFGMEERLCLCHFNVMYPTPGTRLYRQMLTQGQLIRPTWWIDREYRFGQVAFRPAGMSPRELGRLCARARRDFNTPANVLRRLADFRANCRTPRASRRLSPGKSRQLPGDPAKG